MFSCGGKIIEVIARLIILCPENVLPVWMKIPLAIGLGLFNRLVLNALEPGSVRVVFLIWQFRVGSRFPMMLLSLVILIENEHGEWENGALCNPVFG